MFWFRWLAGLVGRFGFIGRFGWLACFIGFDGWFCWLVGKPDRLVDFV